jgi:diguanylate cyclase (GGDEF)-like protein
LFRSPAANGGEIVVLFADLDGFKSVNDTHGHHVGDKVLVAVAERILANVRDIDLVARYGGDEFVLVLPRTARQGGEIVAQRVRQEINEWARKHAIDFNVSIGVGSYPEHGGDLSSVLASVDKAMYRSKNENGRGGILHAEIA